MSQVIKLLPSDSTTIIEVNETVAKMSMTITAMLEDIGNEGTVPLQAITTKTMLKVIEYCTYHIEHPDQPKTDDAKVTEILKNVKDTTVGEWDQKFLNIEQSELFDLMLAANFLDMKPLLEVTCKTVANMIKGKTPEQIRKTFNIKNDFTPGEEEKSIKDYDWCVKNEESEVDDEKVESEVDDEKVESEVEMSVEEDSKDMEA